MSAPPHSIQSPPGGVAGDLYASRNNFLYLLLGLISTAERVLAVVPEIVSTAHDAAGHASSKGEVSGRILR